MDAYQQGAKAADTVECVKERQQVCNDAGSVQSQGRRRLLDRKMKYNRSVSVTAVEGGNAKQVAGTVDMAPEVIPNRLDLRYPLISVSNAGGFVDVSPEPSGLPWM